MFSRPDGASKMLQGSVLKSPHGSRAGPQLAAVTEVAAAAPARCLVAPKWGEPRGFSGENSEGIKQKFLLALPAEVKKLLSMILLDFKVLQLESTLLFLPSQAISTQPPSASQYSPTGTWKNVTQKSPENLAHHFHKGESRHSSGCRRRKRSFRISVKIHSDGWIGCTAQHQGL